MRRREFLGASVAAVVGATVVRPAGALAEPSGGSSGGRQVIEVRTYHFASPEKLKAYETFVSSAGVAAMNRAGVKTVGLFRLVAKENPELKLDADPNDLYMILAHDSAESALALESKLLADAEYQAAGKEILAMGKADPAFERYESMLLNAFEKFPRVKPPAELNAERVLEMRTYQNPNQERAANKVAMFNGGEIPIFERVGMPGVFWGSAVIGPDLPQLTYMVWHKSMEQSAADWKAFGADAEWKVMREKPEFKDNVSKIVKRFLRPVAGSQI